jgi:FAD/FMN-containing dehydrogenase/Fe-S oxidoreductase
MKPNYQHLSRQLNGPLYFDSSADHQSQLLAYSCDASVYQEKPVAVAIPSCKEDLVVLVKFALAHQLTLIPRTAGTSLAGQVVGNGIVVDLSKHFNRILELNIEEKWVTVEPGVIRDDLNRFLAPHGLMFGPETSTASRAMIGGMVGNNSCGLHSIVWGDTRSNLLEASVILSDGSETIFRDELHESENEINNFGKSIRKQLKELLITEETQHLICERFPKPSLKRRNTGYAIDLLLHQQPFADEGLPFNLCSLLAGSEGTLALGTQFKVRLIEVPPREIALVCIHANDLSEILEANLVALKHKPMASELVDKFIMDFTLNHPHYHKNRFFMEGDPAAILMVEFMENSRELSHQKASALIEDLKFHHLGYAYPVLYNHETILAWDIRKAGLGLLRNLKGDAQPVNLIEDCAVSPEDLPAYIADLQLLLKQKGVKASYYAHAGAGELHVEPIINLKSKEGLKQFRDIISETTYLVKKYKGSLSGEHGDGRLRGEFIGELYGPEILQLFHQIKNIFDPYKIFNNGKIVDTPKMDEHLRYNTVNPAPTITTYFDFSNEENMLRLAEKCSGSGDCRRSEQTGGLMCPSFQATRLEKDTTRARANLLRQFLSNPQDVAPLAKEEIKEVMDLCLSCKGCKVDCPSGVDITKMKAEFLQHYYDSKGIPLRSKMIAEFNRQMKLARFFRPLYNFIYRHKPLQKTANLLAGFHPERSMPLLPDQTMETWSNNRTSIPSPSKETVQFFIDEFTNQLDVEIGKKAVQLLERLGYRIELITGLESGRTYLSKGLVKKAAAIINYNLSAINSRFPIVGIEPSAILTLRDEYLDLATPANKQKAKEIAAVVFTIEEFIAAEIDKGRIQSSDFHTDRKKLVLHGHCYQKVLSSQSHSVKMLQLPANYEVEIIPSGCCGMAGSFGYEKEHYEISQQVGELVLFPAIRKQQEDVLIVAAGTSCRHQIKDGTGRKALHPVEVLWNAAFSG